jgi:hypothetical protein
MHHRYFGFFILFILSIPVAFLSACTPTETDLRATETQIAYGIFATLTASVPTITETIAPTETPTPTPTREVTATPIPQAVILTDGLNLREGPSTAYKSLKTLKRNDSLVVLGQTAGCAWLKVALQSGIAGWVKGDAALVTLSASCDTIPHGSYRPANGAVIVDQRVRRGPGQLKIENGTTSDGLVILEDSFSTPVLAIYVWQADQANFAGIADGEYSVYFATGRDWDGDDRHFITNPSLQKFDEPVSYAASSTTYSVSKITLPAVISADAKISAVADADFPEIK